MPSVDYAIVVPTLIGSTLSSLGAGFILICYAVFPQKKHFRHALIINLAISDFLNATNNAISGFHVAATGKFATPSPACTINGFMGQMTVQATDLNILAIALVTLLTLREVIYIPDESLVPKILICLAVWILPWITSFTALGMGLYGPVSGNWCWIKKEPPHMRYVLTHMWRFMVIIASTGIYVHIYLALQRRYKKFKIFPTAKPGTNDSRPFETYNMSDYSQYSQTDSQKAWEYGGQIRMNSITLDEMEAQKKAYQELRQKSVSEEVMTPKAEPPPRFSRVNPMQQNEQRIKRTLLLNAYPIMYILLWIPGIANRIAEASGHPTRVLVIAQASTQFVGLANAITYGINERVWAQLKAVFRKRERQMPLEDRVVREPRAVRGEIQRTDEFSVGDADVKPSTVRDEKALPAVPESPQSPHMPQHSTVVTGGQGARRPSRSQQRNSSVGWVNANNGIDDGKFGHVR